MIIQDRMSRVEDDEDLYEHLLLYTCILSTFAPITLQHYLLQSLY
jgi:hypothetical protein